MVMHGRPAGNFVSGPEAALAQSVGSQIADTNARGQDRFAGGETYRVHGKSAESAQIVRRCCLESSKSPEEGLQIT